MRFERDDGRAEVRKGVAGKFFFFPKIDGLGNVDVTPATAQLYKPNGEAIGSSINLVPSGAESELRVDVPAIADLGEDYFAVITFTPDNATYGTDHPEEIYERTAQVQFDVVLQPWGDSRVSIDNLKPAYATIASRLERIAEVWSDDDITWDVAGVASVFGSRAHADLYRRIRNKITAELAEMSTTRLALGFPLDWYTRPRLIVDRVALEPIEIALALALIFETDLADEGDDQLEAQKLAAYFFAKAESMLRELGGLRYDFTEDRVADTTLSKITGPVVARRVQAR